MSPTDLQDVYGLTSASASNGASQIIAIVDAFHDPHAEADMNVYRANFGMSACTTGNGCFLQVNQNGVAGNYPSTPPPGDDWALEISLDLDMASAICPNCEILLVEADDDIGGGLYIAENTAASCGATVISNSWGGNEYSSETVDESAYFNHPGIMITFASGDGGTGASFPPTSQYVTSVGGTTVMGSLGAWTETVWAGSGSGCSAFITQPLWQTSLALGVCPMRMSNDVAAAADPNFGGAAVYDTLPPRSGWLQVGGTSEATPIIAGVYALAQNGSGITYGSYSYSHTGSFHDITSGSNGSCSPSILCTAGSGWDGPSGNGTPNGVGGF
jgi:subtilase family serine protease